MSTTHGESEYLADLMGRSFALYLRERYPGSKWKRVKGDDLLTTREVAEQLNVSAETVLRLHKRGELPAIRLASNALRFQQTDLDAFLEERKEGKDKVST